jgi:hypothetical protein
LISSAEGQPRSTANPWRERYGSEVEQLVHDLRPTTSRVVIAVDLVKGVVVTADTGGERAQLWLIVGVDRGQPVVEPVAARSALSPPDSQAGDRDRSTNPDWPAFP